MMMDENMKGAMEKMHRPMNTSDSGRLRQHVISGARTSNTTDFHRIKSEPFIIIIIMLDA
jgi:hypothetical protein